MSQYGYDYPNKKKNQVTQSMISTVSEAFEFEDFLGEKTTLKDRVPKNKANLDKKIVHFSRQVVEDRTNAPNTLSSYNTNTSYQNKNTFENYMSDDFYNKLREKQSSSIRVEAPKPYQAPSYTTSQVNSYSAPKLEFNSSQSYKSSTASSYSSSTVKYQQKTYNNQSPYEFNSKYAPSYGNGYQRVQTQNSQNQISNGYSGSYKPSFNVNSYGTKQINTYAPSYYKQPVSFNKPSSYGDRNDWTSKSTGGNTNYSYSQNKSTSYYNNPQPSYSVNTYSYKPYEPSSQPQLGSGSYGVDKKDNQYYDRSYDSYGEYAKDFSSPDIMAILTKRRKP